MPKNFIVECTGKTREELIQIIEQLKRDLEKYREKEDKCELMENRLRRSEANLLKAQEIAHLGYAIWNIKNNDLEWSDEVYRIFGVNPHTFYPTHEAFILAIHPYDRDMVKRTLDAAFRKEKPYKIVYRIYRPDGSLRYVSSQGEVAFDSSGRPESMLMTVFDITGRKLAEIDLARSQKIAHLGHWIWDIRNNRVKWSDEVYRIFGLDPRSFKPTYEAYMNAVHPEDRDGVNKAVDAAFKKEKPYDITYRIVRPDGSVRYVNSQGEVIFDQSGEPMKMLRTVLDITERKLVEIKLQELKEQAELYVDIMAHDINNLNQITLGNLDLLQAEPGLTPEQLEFISSSMDAVEGSASIIDSVRKLQKITEEELPRELDDICVMIKECIKEAPRVEGKNVTINYTPRIGMVVNGTKLLKEAFCNLINNSIKYSEDNVTIDIVADDVFLGDKKYYRISIIDNGYGIPEEVKPRLFHRFVRGTTKAHGKGLGLYIVRTLVEKFGGSVSVENRIPDDYTKGSKFIVMLPACEGC